MHVVFLARRYAPHVGGVERHLEGVIRTLLQRDSETQITVITEQHQLDLPLQEKKAQVSVYRIPLFPSIEHPDTKQSIAAGVRNLLEVLRTADVIHVHDVFFWLITVLPQLIGKKIFITFHGYEVPGPPSLKQRWWHQLADIGTDGNICIGGFHQKWYGVDPTIISYGAVDISKPPTQPTKKTVFESHKQKFLFVGRLEEDTGIWVYLEALAKMKRSSLAPDFSLDIIGDGQLRPQLEQLVKDEQLPVRFLGKQTVTTAMYQGYTASLVSGYMTILESLYAGVPVISTYVTNLKYDYLKLSPFAQWIEIASPGQMLVDALSVDHQLASEAQEWAKQQTWDKLTDQYLHLWGWNTDGQ